MNITIKMGGAVFALRLDPADLRAIALAATLVLHPASQPAVEELQRAVAAEFATWLPPGVPEIRAANIRSGEVGPGEVQ